MFNAIIKHAQATVEQTIDNAISRVVSVIPFIIAAGFGVAALSLRLTRLYGAEIAMAMMAAGFALLGLILVIYVAVTRRMARGRVEAPAESTAQARAADNSGGPADKGMSDAERELTLSALTTALPVALPSIIKLVMRNLPLLAAIAAAIYVFTRSPGTSGLSTDPDLAGDPASNDNSNFTPAQGVAAE